MVYIRFFLIATTTLVVAILMSGMSTCAEPKQIGPRAVSDWAYAPDSIKVHPLSRFTHDGKLVVHATLLDGDGFACRGVGTLNITISTTSISQQNSNTIHLEDSEENRKYFDYVTRTYRIPIKSVAAELDKVTVKVTFTGVKEEPLKSDTYTVVRKKTQ